VAGDEIWGTKRGIACAKEVAEVLAAEEIEGDGAD